MKTPSIAPADARESMSAGDATTVMSRRLLLGSLGAGAGLTAAVTAAVSAVAAAARAATTLPPNSPAQTGPAATELPRNAGDGGPLTEGGLTYSKFKLYQALDSDLDTAPELEFPFIAGSKFKAVNTGINEPATQVNYEDFYPGLPIVWTMFHDEVQYVVSGRAQITFHLAPLMQETGTVVAEPGCIYLLPRGAHIVWRVLGTQPFRHLCVCIPNPGYPLPPAASVFRAGGGEIK